MRCALPIFLHNFGSNPLPIRKIVVRVTVRVLLQFCYILFMFKGGRWECQGKIRMAKQAVQAYLYLIWSTCYMQSWKIQHPTWKSSRVFGFLEVSWSLVLKMLEVLVFLWMKTHIRYIEEGKKTCCTMLLYIYIQKCVFYHYILEDGVGWPPCTFFLKPLHPWLFLKPSRYGTNQTPRFRWLVIDGSQGKSKLLGSSRFTHEGRENLCPLI